MKEKTIETIGLGIWALLSVIVAAVAMRPKESVAEAQRYYARQAREFAGERRSAF
ncbi:MAG: hypothetical protein M5R36_28230 [Deltaproteobacteria bacterium]|nr:hypothetical protein [Deltaproteobacteria bacterium]